jgi:hypothetical protein
MMLKRTGGIRTRDTGYRMQAFQASLKRIASGTTPRKRSPPRGIHSAGCLLLYVACLRHRDVEAEQVPAVAVLAGGVPELANVGAAP